MDVVSLFAGIGGFDLGFERAGFKIVGHAEKDANCRKLLGEKWPDAVCLDDVCTAGSHNLPPCDVVTFGFPCQDLSVAGKRAGLAGGRSGLFYEATRIIDELKPAYCLFENVPGLLSSDGGRDFWRVLRQMDEIGYHGAWRTLDAQWFGVAQRRRRVFGLFSRLDSGAERCAQVLSLGESLRGHPAPSREAGKVAPCLAASGVGAGRTGNERNEVDFCIEQGADGFTTSSFGAYKQGVGTCRANGGDNGGGSETIVVVALTAKGPKDYGAAQVDAGHYIPINKEKWPKQIADTLTCAYAEKQGLEDQHINGGAGLFVLSSGQANAACAKDVAHALDCLHETQIVAKGPDGDTKPGHLIQISGQIDWRTANADTGRVAQTLKTDLAHASGPCLAVPGEFEPLSVRRLTPTECEKLQGFTTNTKRCMLSVCLDHQRSVAHVAVKCRKWPDNVWLVGAGEKTELVNIAGSLFRSDQESQGALVAVHVRMQSEPKVAAILNRGRLCWSVNGAESKNSFPLSIPPDAFAQETATLIQFLEKEADSGKVESQQSMTLSIHRSSGGDVAPMCGQEKRRSASDAETICQKGTFIIFTVDQDTQKHDLTKATLFCSVINAIASFIPSEIPGESFYLALDLESDYTAGFSDSVRYRMLGNAVCVKVSEWIAMRLAKEFQ